MDLKKNNDVNSTKITQYHIKSYTLLFKVPKLQVMLSTLYLNCGFSCELT